MASELNEFEENMQREIDAFLKPDKRKPRQPGRGAAAPGRPAKSTAEPAESAETMKTGHRVKLAVRKRQLDVDTVFEHRSTSISKLEAQLEAEKAAKRAGYPIIGYLVDIQRL
ncbi:hypothetical protein [Billgrantia gudaonensis]|uniref:Uncharacterized protein n=1 Tax=Billgrantia gudaonensis TaxID=376427 RepID=A0A1G8MJ49_9GAMM|nr:hypothetical protein [Halomonas gudaonensis]SDI68038.1 hypothetical protein SAMN04487954_10122 [Halomonas gudaonensis]